MLKKSLFQLEKAFLFQILSVMSIGEIMLIMLIILMFFGSESIPSIARSLGRGLRQFRDAASEIKTEIKKSADKIIDDAGINNENKSEFLSDKKSIRLDQDFEQSSSDELKKDDKQ